MTYAEFAARPTQTNDDEALTVVMRWHLEIDGDYTVWMDADGNKRADRYELSPTTDRNATAMLAEEVTKRGSQNRTMYLIGRELGHGGILECWDLLLAAPSLVAWACVEACRGGAS